MDGFVAPADGSVRGGLRRFFYAEEVEVVAKSRGKRLNHGKRGGRTTDLSTARARLSVQRVMAASSLIAAWNRLIISARSARNSDWPLTYLIDRPGLLLPDARERHRAALYQPKSRIAAAGIPFETPDAAGRAERLAGVAALIYLQFNEAPRRAAAPSMSACPPWRSSRIGMVTTSVRPWWRLQAGDRRSSAMIGS
jgi:hypothetical protein